MDFMRAALAIVTWPLALAALAVSLLAQGGRVNVKLDVLTHFAPLYLAAAVLALLLATLTPRGGRTALLVVSLLAVAGNLALMAPEFLSQAPDVVGGEASGQSLKIIQFNAWGGNPRGDEAVEWLAGQDADIIVMEEAPKLRDKLIARGYHASCLSCGAVIFARNKPIRTFAEPPRDGHPSYLASATFGDGRGEFTVVGVHRYWPIRFERDRVQTANLHDYLRELPKERLILAGDFNSTPWSFARRREDIDLGLIRRTRAMFSWPAAQLSHNRLPAPFPYLPIDHLYAGSAWTTVKVERGPELGSDHYPIIVTLAAVETAAR